MVGNGERVRIWGDPWMSTPPSYQVISLRKEGCTIDHVAELIDQPFGQWKEDLVREWLLPFEAKEVLSMPLSSIPFDDTYVWSYDKSGEYTVKSGYNFITFYKGAMEGECGPSEGSKLWKKVWGLIVPPKVRVFVWRLCSNALPTAKGLHRRIENISPLCHRCEREDESSLHAIWGCKYIGGVWESEELDCMWDCPQLGCIKDWVAWWICSTKGVEASRVATVTWMCWNERNNVLHGKQPRTPGEIVAAALSMLDAYEEAKGDVGGEWKSKEGGGGVRCVKERGRGGAVWKPPEGDTIKINADGAIFKDQGVGMGVVLRDSNGGVIRAACHQVKHQWDVAVTEAKAYSTGVKHGSTSQCSSNSR